MKCVMCETWVIGRNAEHIAIDEKGEPIVMCEECYQKARPFFEEVKPDGEINT